MTKLNVQKRETDAKINELRAQKLIPAVVYSKGEIGLNLAISHIEFEKVYRQAGESTLVDLVFADKSEKNVLIHDIQVDPIKNKFLHIDFYEVDLNKKVNANVELEFVGEAPVVKNEGGIVIKQISELEIECLPIDLIKKFKVDISLLTDFTSTIHVKDLKISDRITILNNPDDVVVNVSEPRASEEEKSTEEAPTTDTNAVTDNKTVTEAKA